jgi:hypothetical protein
LQKWIALQIFAEGVGGANESISTGSQRATRPDVNGYPMLLIAAIGQRFDAAGAAPYKILHINLFTFSVRITSSER